MIKGVPPPRSTFPLVLRWSLPCCSLTVWVLGRVVSLPPIFVIYSELNRHGISRKREKECRTISDVHPARSRAIARTERHNNRHDLLAVEYYQLLAILPSRSTSIDTLTRFTTRPSVSALLSRLSYRYPAQGCAVRAGARSASSPTQLLSLAWYTHTLCARLGARAGH